MHKIHLWILMLFIGTHLQIILGNKQIVMNYIISAVERGRRTSYMVRGGLQFLLYIDFNLPNNLKFCFQC